MDLSKNLIPAVACLALVLAVGLACSGSSAKDLKQAGPEFVGVWNSAEGGRIVIRSDGSGDYVNGGTKVTGGSARVSDSEKTLSLTIIGVGPTFKIDKAPDGDKMTLDGVVYKKAKLDE